MTDNPELDSVMEQASQTIGEAARERRMMDTFRLNAAVAAHVRWAYHTMCGEDANELAPMPPELAQWHLIQAHGRALASWYQEDAGSFAWKGQA